jgi:hypothetical protein
MHAQIARARARDARERKTGLRAVSARYDRRRSRIVLELATGYLFGVPVSALPHLEDATPAQLGEVEVSPEGGGLRFPSIDADYSVPGLILALTAREIGRNGGTVKSAAKTRAARANGAKGGRPRKQPTR